MYLPAEDGDNQQERAVLREWEHVQESLFVFALAVPSQATSNHRLLLDQLITRTTRGCAKVWWAPYTNVHGAKPAQLLEVRYRNIRYGLLELAAGYLVSHLQPRIPQHTDCF